MRLHQHTDSTRNTNDPDGRSHSGICNTGSSLLHRTILGSIQPTTVGCSSATLPQLRIKTRYRHHHLFLSFLLFDDRLQSLLAPNFTTDPFVVRFQPPQRTQNGVSHVRTCYVTKLLTNPTVVYGHKRIMKIVSGNRKQIQLVNILVGKLRLPILQSCIFTDDYIGVVCVVILGGLNMLLLRSLQDALRDIPSLEADKRNTSALWANRNS